MRQSLVAPAKVSPPRLAAVLPRERLFARLDELRNCPIVWIGGCPGAGKTTLVANYLEARQLRGLWYRMNRDDHDGQGLFDFLSASSIGAELPAAAMQQATKGARPSRAEFAGNRGVSTRLFTRKLYERLSQPGVLVLDDCHEVAPDSVLHALLVDSAGEIPRGLNIILVGRGEPPSLYSRLISNDTVGLLDSRDLNFTLDETRALAARISPDDQMPERLHCQTAGWAAGVAMTLVRLLRYASDAQPAEQEMRRAVFGYYAGEIFDRASAEERRILVSTALVPKLSGTAAQELTGSTHAQKLLNRLECHQLFTTNIAGTYEYAPLFREFLLTRLEETLAPDDLNETVNRAASLVGECRELEALAALTVRTRNWPSLLHLIGRHGMRLLAQGHAATVRKWVEEFPAETYADDPWLTYWSGAASLNVSPCAARKLLEKAWHRFEERTDRMGQLLAAAAMLESHQTGLSSVSSIVTWIDRVQACLHAVRTIPTREAELRVYANLLFAFASVRASSESSATYVEPLQSLLDSDVDVNHRVFAGRALLLAHCSMFELELAREVAQRLQSMIEEQGCCMASRVAALNAAAYALWFEGAYSSAAAVIREAAQSARQVPSYRPDALHLRTRYLLAFAQRDRQEMGECIDALRQVIKSGDDLGTAMLSKALALQAYLRGDLTAAANHWGAAASQADAAGVRPLQWISRLALSGCRATLGDYSGAAEGLQQAWAQCEGTLPPAWRRDYDLVSAYVALRRGDRTECQRLLSVALDTARCAGTASHIIPMLSSAMAELSVEAIRCGITAVRNLVQHYRLPPPATADRDWPWPFKVYVLGTFRLLKGDVPLRFSRRTQKRTLELLQALIAFGGEDVSAGALTDALWPDSDGDAGYHALESSLYRLRQLLGAPCAVTMSGGKLSLNRSYFWVDMWAFERSLQSSGTRACDALARFERIRQLYLGHFIAHDSDKPWAIETRSALRDKYLRAIREAARAYESREQWQEAASVYRTGIELDKMAEDLYRGLMICHRELGDHTEVLQVYRRCRELLTRMLGVQPNPKTQAIYHSVRENQVAQSA